MKYKPFPTELRLYFVTSRITAHKSIFFEDNLAKIPLNALAFYAQKKLWNIYAFCLMPNHLHTLLQTARTVTIEKQMGELHKYTAHKIVEMLANTGKHELLRFFQRHAQRKSDRKHLVWEDAIAKAVLSESYLLTVLEYIHNNPCNKGWQLVKDRADYKYSSARFYDRGGAPVIPVTDIRQVWFELGEQLK
jgi:REP element-mobilizing transposase RayT